MKISPVSLVSIGGVAAIAGGALRIVSAFIPYQPETLWLETLYAVEDYFMLVGISAFYLHFSGQLGALGVLAFCLTSAGFASIVGPDPIMFGVNFYELGALAIIVGLAALSAQMLRKGIAYAASILWLISVALTLSSVVFEAYYLVVGAGVFFGSAFVSAGWVLFRNSRKHNLPFNDTEFGAQA